MKKGCECLLIMMTVFLFSGLAAEARQSTLAILPFDNNSVTEAEKYDPLRNGLSVMLMAELSNTDAAFKLVERAQIKALLDEISLGQTGAIDAATAAKLGKLLGAQSIGFGAFMVMGKMVRIDMRIVRVETGEIIMAEAITGSADDFFTLERDLAVKIADAMKTRLTTSPGESKSSIDAAIFFGKGLEASEDGDAAAAQRFFDQAIRLDSSYRQKVDRLQNI